MKTRDLTLLAACISILFVQEQVLSFIPNIMFTTVLIFVFSKVFDFKKSILIVVVHVTLDNMAMGSLTPATYLPMLIGWSLIPISLHTFLKRVNNEYVLAVIGYVFGHVYGFIFLPFAVWLLSANFKAYLLADISFEIIMGVCNFLTILYLYKPIENIVSALIEEKTSW